MSYGLFKNKKTHERELKRARRLQKTAKKQTTKSYWKGAERIMLKSVKKRRK